MCWQLRFKSWWKRLWGLQLAGKDLDSTDEFATMSSITLLPGQMKLKVGVVSFPAADPYSPTWPMAALRCRP